MTVAGRVLARWRRDPANAPEWLDRPEAVTAFLQGAMAPDMGFVPGVDRLVSEAAHYLRPADLTRNLLAVARSHEEEAFAWGWANHVLVDVEIHPIVGRAVGERLFGSRDRRVDALYDVATHVSLEVGLDMALLRSEPCAPRPPARPVLGASVPAGSLAQALGRTYDLDWDPFDLVRSHRRAVAMTRWWPRLLSILPLQPPGPRPAGTPPAGGSDPAAEPSRWLARMGSRMAKGAAPGTTPFKGLVAPEAPRRWFMDEVEEGIERSVELFFGWMRDGLAGIRNANLETGVPTRVGTGHPATDLAYRKVEEVRSGRAVHPACL
jgi:hypothetical protein